MIFFIGGIKLKITVNTQAKLTDLPLPLRLWFYLFSQCLFWHFEKLFWDASRCRHEILSVT